MNNYMEQNHNVNIDRTKSGDENEEADITTNVGLTMLIAMQTTN